MNNPTAEIEFVQGNESHTSTWAKYYIKGLESFTCKEDHALARHDRHHSYSCHVGIEIPDGTLFTIYEQSGDSRGTNAFCFQICVIDSTFEHKDDAEYADGFCNGNFRVIAQGLTKTKAPRLMGWWNDNNNPKTFEFAKHCEKYINKRGVSIIPELDPAPQSNR